MDWEQVNRASRATARRVVIGGTIVLIMLAVLFIYAIAPKPKEIKTTTLDYGAIVVKCMRWDPDGSQNLTVHLSTDMPHTRYRIPDVWAATFKIDREGKCIGSGTTITNSDLLKEVQVSAVSKDEYFVIYVGRQLDGTHRFMAGRLSHVVTSEDLERIARLCNGMPGSDLTSLRYCV